MNYNHILLFHNLAALKIRIERVLDDFNVMISEAGEENTYYEMLKEAGEGYSLILLDLPKNPELAMNLISRTREIQKDTPIIILTDSGKEKFYIESILKGATDFIIKPFQDQTVIDKVSKHLNADDINRIEFITLDLTKYIKGELRKAEKGNFPLSLMLLNFEDIKDKSGIASNQAAMIFDNIKDIFWDTDVFLKFASKYYLGVFPFCSNENTKIILTKMQERYAQMQRLYPMLREYDMVTVFSTYPYDSDDTSQIFDILIDRISKS